MQIRKLSKVIRGLRRRVKLWFCRSWLSDVEDAMASLQGGHVSLLMSVEISDGERRDLSEHQSHEGSSETNLETGPV